MAEIFSDQLATMTLNKHLAQLYEQIWLGKVISARLLTQGNVKQSFDGGVQLIVPLETSKNSTVKNYTGDQAFIDDNDFAGNASYDWHGFGGLMKYTQDEIDINAGSNKVIDYLVQKANNLRMSLEEHLEKLLLQKRGTSGAAALSWHGIRDHVGIKDQETNPPGGIATNSSTNEYWEPYHKTQTGSALAIETVTDVIYHTSRGNTDKCTCIFSRIPMYSQANHILFDQQRFADPKMGEAGFDSISVLGVPWFFLDDKIATSTIANGGVDVNIGDKDIYFLNENHIKFYCHATNWMMSHGFQRADNATVFRALITAKGTLAFSRRSSQGFLQLSG